MIIGIVIGSILFVLLVLYLLIGYYCFKIAFVRKTKMQMVPTDIKLKFNEDWYNNTPNDDIKIDSIKKVVLKGKLFKVENSKNFIISVHGYRGNKKETSYFCSQFYQKGYNILMVDDRGCGESSGKYITMGCLDVYDVVNWVNYLNKRFGSDIKIILYGWSMGAAIIMGASKYLNNTNVKAIIEDSGYSSTYEEFKHVGKKNFKFIPSWILLSSLSIFSFFHGISFKKNSAISNLKESKIPTLFIHGGADDFVPTNMVYKCYESLPIKEKELRVFDKSIHVCCLTDYGDEYINLVYNFIKRYL